jgi:hypothetical protein
LSEPAAVAAQVPDWQGFEAWHHRCCCLGQEDTQMTKTISILSLVSALSLTLGATTAQAQDASAPTRGQVSVKGAAVKSVVVGPVAIHAYSAFSGGALYAVKAVTGTDADCQGQAEGARAELRADGIVNFTVGAGQVACLATSTTRSFELLWHAQKDAPAASLFGSLLARN